MTLSMPPMIELELVTRPPLPGLMPKATPEIAACLVTVPTAPVMLTPVPEPDPQRAKARCRAGIVGDAAVVPKHHGIDARDRAGVTIGAAARERDAIAARSGDLAGVADRPRSDAAAPVDAVRRTARCHGSVASDVERIVSRAENYRSGRVAADRPRHWTLLLSQRGNSH